MKIILSAFSDAKDKIVVVTQPAVGDSTKQTKNDIQNFAIVAGSTKSKDARNSAIKRSLQVDSLITSKSKESEEIEFNNLKQIGIKAEFVYNFFVPEEKNYVTEENPLLDPLLKDSLFDVPRYVKLTWESQSVSEELSDVDTDFQLFMRPTSNQGKIKPYVKDGEEFDLVDIHRIR